MLFTVFFEYIVILFFMAPIFDNWNTTTSIWPLMFMTHENQIWAMDTFSTQTGWTTYTAWDFRNGLMEFISLFATLLSNIKDVKNQRELKRCLKMHIFHRTYISFTLHKAFLLFFNITNKSIIFISESCSFIVQKY